jgi:hypothetical protein
LRKTVFEIIALTSAFLLAVFPLFAQVDVGSDPRIVKLIERADSQDRLHVGTGFFVESDFGGVYLVTARHVAEGFDLEADVVLSRGENGRSATFELRIPREAWVFHPRGPQDSFKGVDVAVTEIEVEPERGLSAFAATELGMDPSPLEGLVSVLGYPAAKRQLSLLITFILPRPVAPDGKAFRMDGLVDKGNSGAPVMSWSNSNRTVFGLYTGETDASESKKFSLAEPVSRIRETIDRARSLQPARQMKEKPSLEKVPKNGSGLKVAANLQ